MKKSKAFILVVALLAVFVFAAPVSATKINTSPTHAEPITDMSVTMDGFDGPEIGAPLPFDESKLRIPAEDKIFYSVKLFIPWSGEYGFYVEDGNPVFEEGKNYRFAVMFIPNDFYTVNPEACNVTILGKKATYDSAPNPYAKTSYCYYVDFNFAEEITEMSASISGFTEPKAGEPLPFEENRFLSGDRAKYTVEKFIPWSGLDGYYEDDDFSHPVFQANETYRLAILFVPRDGYYVDPQRCEVTICGKKATYNDQCKPKDVPCYYYYIDYTLLADGDFNDVTENDYFYDAVRWASAHDITKGVSRINFAPNAVCTRAQIVTFLWRAYGCPEPVSIENPFTDVNEGDYFYKAVLWAVEQGITDGISATKFGPDHTCTRAQICTFIWRGAGKEKPSDFRSAMNDLDPDSYFYQAVLWAIEKGITKGTSRTAFSPGNGCTRGQSVTFLYRHAFAPMRYHYIPET